MSYICSTAITSLFINRISAIGELGVPAFRAVQCTCRLLALFLQLACLKSLGLTFTLFGALETSVTSLVKPVTSQVHEQSNYAAVLMAFLSQSSNFSWAKCVRRRAPIDVIDSSQFFTQHNFARCVMTIYCCDCQFFGNKFN